MSEEDFGKRMLANKLTAEREQAERAGREQARKQNEAREAATEVSALLLLRCKGFFNTQLRQHLQEAVDRGAQSARGVVLLEDLPHSIWKYPESSQPAIDSLYANPEFTSLVARAKQEYGVDVQVKVYIHKKYVTQGVTSGAGTTRKTTGYRMEGSIDFDIRPSF